MPRDVLRPGRICVITRGRDRGKKCVIVGILDDFNVLITGPKELNGVKRGKKNILHLFPLNETIRIRANAKDETVLSAIEKSELKKFMTELIRIEKPR
ncbi:MAG: KOW motif-containing protein [Crenarchaeota archaeon]|nr:KOW motif-containing protein [Thermoproteota archaeon]MDW8033932.1 KOW motif-containing protein [Nitrososphaerota archaeon]